MILVAVPLLVIGHACEARILAYDLHLTLSAEWQLDGVLTMSGAAADDWSELMLRIYQPGVLTVTSIEVGGVSLEWEEIDPSLLRVPVVLELGQTYSLTAEFSGRVPPFSASSRYGTFAVSDQAVVLGAAHPMLAAWDEEWLTGPVLGWGDVVVADVADYRAVVDAPEGWTVVSGGREISLSKTLSLVEGERLRELSFVLVRGYVVQTMEVEGVTVRSFSLPAHAAGAAEALRVVGRALELFQEAFGPYPFCSLDVVAVPLHRAAGVEYPGLVLAGEAYYARWHEEPLLFPMIFAHEIAHQWWFAQVGSHQVDEPWVDEALATYSSGLYFEEEGRLEEIIQYWGDTFRLGRERNSSARVDSPLWKFPGGVGYGGIVYSGGALMLHEVRLEMGDEAFSASLRDYLESHKWGISSGDDLLAALDRRSPSALEEIIFRYLSSP